MAAAITAILVSAELSRRAAKDPRLECRGWTRFRRRVGPVGWSRGWRRWRGVRSHSARHLSRLPLPLPVRAEPAAVARRILRARQELSSRATHAPDSQVEFVVFPFGTPDASTLPGARLEGPFGAPRANGRTACARPLPGSARTAAAETSVFRKSPSVAGMARGRPALCLVLAAGAR